MDDYKRVMASRKQIQGLFIFIVAILVLVTAIFILYDFTLPTSFKRLIGWPTARSERRLYTFDDVFECQHLQSWSQSTTTTMRLDPYKQRLSYSLPAGYVIRYSGFQKDSSKQFGPKRNFEFNFEQQFGSWNFSQYPNPYILPSSIFEDQNNSIYSSCRVARHQETYERGNGTKRIAFYNIPNWLEDGISFENCRVSNCIMLDSSPSSSQNAHAVVFSIPDLHQTRPPSRPMDQIWVYFSMESPINLPYKTDLWRDKFNLTMTYRMDSDIFLPYAYLKRREPWLQKPKEFYESIARSKTSLAAIMVSNCKQENSRRLDYVRELQKYIPVDVYGKCGPYKCYSRRSGHCLDILEDKYKFYLSFENSICEDYVTEKFFKLFRNINIVPVVRGGSVYHKILPNNTYINSDWFESPRELALYLKRLDKDESRYADILREKDVFVEADDLPVSRAFCDLCLRLHTPSSTNGHLQFYTRADHWFGRGMCHDPEII